MLEFVDGRLISTGTTFNYAQLNDAGVNDLLDRVVAATDAKVETQLAAELDTKVMDTAALVPYAADRALNYHSARLTNVLVNDAYGMIDFSSLGVA